MALERQMQPERLGGIMDFANRGNRPTQAPQQPEDNNIQKEERAMNFTPTKTSPKRPSVGLRRLPQIIVLFGTAIIITALIVGLVFGEDSSQAGEADLINPDRYQAVFLDSPDGQVYFGRLNVYNDQLYSLTDIYYVRVESSIQPETEGQQAASNISLAKLGSELHGPEDAMFISRDKVLFWENLKDADESQVVNAITEFVNNGRQTTDTQTQTPTTTTETQQTGTDQQIDTDTTDQQTP